MGNMSGDRSPLDCHSEPAGEESRPLYLQIHLTTPRGSSTQYTGDGELSGNLTSPENEILRLRAQNDNRVGCDHLIIPSGRSIHNDRVSGGGRLTTSQSRCTEGQGVRAPSSNPVSIWQSQTRMPASSTAKTPVCIQNPAPCPLTGQKLLDRIAFVSISPSVAGGVPCKIAQPARGNSGARDCSAARRTFRQHCARRA